MQNWMVHGGATPNQKIIAFTSHSSGQRSGLKAGGDRPEGSRCVTEDGPPDQYNDHEIFAVNSLQMQRGDSP
jgi:hypothetical protein